MTSSALDYPALDADVDLLRRFFDETRRFPELRNPHVEPRVSEAIRAEARPAAVLIAVIDDEAAPQVIVTRRNRNIRFAGQLCFPGGRTDVTDRNATDTALREAHEEIGLEQSRVDVLGRLGDYHTQTGYRITPVVGVVARPLRLAANPAEVEAIVEISLARVLRSASYTLTFMGNDRGHYSYHEGDVRIAGPTVSLMIGLYEALLGYTGALP